MSHNGGRKIAALGPSVPRMRFLLAALLTTLCAVTSAQDRTATVWLSGLARDRKLDASVGAKFQGVGLRDALGELAKQERVCVLLDRRIDPSRELRLDVGGPLRSVLEQLATERGAAVAILPGVVYLGPSSTAAALPPALKRLREAAAAVDRTQRKELTTARRWTWTDLAAPRDLLAQLQRESKWRIEGVDEIPHDLWGAGELPALSWLDRASLVLAQFDRTLELDAKGRVARIVPLPPADPSEARAAARPARRPTAGRRTAKLEVREAPLKDVLRSIAVQFELELQVDPGMPAEALAEPVTFKAGELELQPLLKRLLQGRAAFQLDGNLLRILPP